jgi:plasmid stabilization system protein ParE
MVEVVWAEPAIADLDAIADYIVLENPRAAGLLVQRVFRHVEQLASHPRSGTKLPGLRGWRYRQIVEPPVRVIYRVEKRRVYMLHVIRGERLLQRRVLAARSRTLGK